MASAPPFPDRFHELFLQSGVAQALIAPDGTISTINAAAARLLDRRPEELEGQALLPRLPGHDREADEQLLRDLAERRHERLQLERRLLRHDGTWIDALVSVAPVVTDAGVREISVCLQDITALKTAQRAAERAEARWRSLSQNASDIAMIVDEALTITYASASLTPCLGFTEAELVGHPLPSLVHPEDVERISAVLRRITHEDRELLVELRVRSSSGEWRRVEQRVVNLLHDPDVAGLVVNLRDVTERHDLQTTLQRAVLEDTLTRLPNRALLMDRIEQAVEAERAGGPEYGLVLVNIDRLAAINDAFGHVTGDELLCRAADVLCALVRPGDTVARYSGDEFAILLTGPSAGPAGHHLAERIRSALNTDLERPGKPGVHYSACVGLAHGPTETAEGLVSAAAAATARAKELGRGRLHVLEDTARARVSDRRTLAAELAEAVARDQLRVHYQPIVELRTGAIAGFEALVRWDHRERGLLGPQDFLPLAEALDLQFRIDEWVLHQACDTATRWPGGPGEHVGVSVNVAPARLIAPGFVESVHQALEQSQLDPRRLTLEVTETAVVADVVRAEQVLTMLSSMGVRVSIDDFGTGYSSMLQLRQLPFHKLKIDREFVRQLPSSRDDTAICASVISLAAQLRVDVIAEGIEDDAQTGVLHSLGCRFGQGFRWSGGVPAAETLALLEQTPWAAALPTTSSRRSGSGRMPSPDPVVAAQAKALHESGASLQTITASLNRSYPGSNGGKRWHPSTVARMLYQISCHP